MSTRVLIADRDSATQASLKKCCESLHVKEIEAAADGGVAEKHIAAKTYDLYLLDQDLPGRSGLELLQVIRRSQADAPVLFISSDEDKARVVEAIKAGVSDFVHRPVDTEDVSKKLRSWLQLVGHVVQAEAETGPGESEALKTVLQSVGPFAKATSHAFRSLFGIELTRSQPYRAENLQPPRDVTGIVKLTGAGSTALAILSVDRHVAFRVTQALAGHEVSQLNDDVRKAVGQLAKIVADFARADLPQFQWAASDPTAMTGRFHSLEIPSGAVPIAIPFECRWGDITVLFAISLS